MHPETGLSNQISRRVGGNHVRLLALESEEESCAIIAPLRSYIIYGRGEGECLDLDL